MLRDLSILKNNVVSDFQNNYKNEEMTLPVSFINDITQIGKDSIQYFETTAVVTTPKGLNIYFPNQWFYIASFFTQYYVELVKYKQTVYDIFPDFDKEKAEQFQRQSWHNVSLPKNSLSDQEQTFLKKFLSDDYKWWNGAKTIDRGDFYVSPILNMANVVNASQSYIADLCVFLSQKPDAVKKLIDFYNSKDLKENVLCETFDYPFQRIFYGAPGTGKSNTIKCEVEDKGRVHFRTTFHPDSDYSTFVGCYKPTMVEAPVRDGSGHEVKEAKQEEKNRISYSFVPQSFTKAYCEAWNKYGESEDAEPVFLIIEEINRGNCAQIFGDIFQLLDREMDGDRCGFSTYPIDADEDLKAFLEVGVKKDGSQWLTNKEGIKDGKLCLPPNLYIWATMNTSDQSLFPIDSAFKRRWDWKYVPINTKAKEGWMIDANGAKYSWSDFLEKINTEIEDTTSSEDKQLGFFFCKADGTDADNNNGVISAEKFVSKVLFYLYNDVFKDYGLEREFLKIQDGDDKGKTISFRRLYKMNGDINENQVAKILNNLGVELLEDIKPTGEELQEDDENENDSSLSSSSSNYDRSKYSINGVGNFGKGNVAYEALKIYVANNPRKNAMEVVNEWLALGVNVPNFVETSEMYEERTAGSTDPNLGRRYKIVTLPNGQTIYVSNQYNPERISDLIEKVNSANWNITISQV